MKEKILHIIIVLVCGACARPAEIEEKHSIPDWLGSLAPLEEQFAIRSQRPRLYLTGDDLPLVRSRIQSSHSQAWAMIQQAKSSPGLRDRILANAFSYLVTGSEKEARAAIEAALELSANTNGDDLPNAYRVWPEAVAFDWCHDRFKPEEAEKLLTNIKAQLEIAGGRNLETQPPHAGHLVNHLADAHLPAGIAFYETAPEIFNRAVEVIRIELAAKNVFYRYGASSQGNSYGVTHFNGDIRMLAMLLKATGVDLFERFPFYRDVGYYWIYTRRPDGQLLRNGDDWLDSGNHTKIAGEEGALEVSGVPYGAMERMWTNPWLTELLLYSAAKYRDPYLLNEYLLIRKPANTWTNIIDILWRDPELQPAGPQSLPVIRYRGGPVGTLFFRTGWGPDDVAGMFKVMPLFVKNHDHLDRLSFQIYCRGALALDSGLYEGTNSEYDSDHWLDYFQRTIAHNTLLIRDPDEKVFYRGRQVVADGGQPYPENGANPADLAALMDPQWRIARVLAQEVDKDQRYAFVVGDATSGYGPKAELVKRTFVFLKDFRSSPPAELPAAALVVYDQVRSLKPESRKVWLLHSMEEPEVDQGRFTVRRSGPEYGGCLVSFTLLPEPARVEKIGGPGKDFWVNDTNYPTEKRGDAEGGAWRIEVSPEGKEAAVNFLHAILIYPHEPGSKPEAGLVKGKRLAGADLPEWTVVMPANGEKMRSLEYSSTGTGKRTHLVLGLPAGSEVTAKSGDKVLAQGVTSPEGSFVFGIDQSGKMLLRISVK
ncbi:MAG TPA: heparinase II/III family protein [archaeon]|nr:heparinase II/III family protein [archaeon]